MTPEDGRYDLIISDVKKINAITIAKARKAQSKRLTQEAWEQAKASGLKKIKLSDYTVSTRKIEKTDLVSILNFVGVIEQILIDSLF